MGCVIYELLTLTKVFDATNPLKLAQDIVCSEFGEIDPRYADVCKISLSFRFRISLSDMTNYKSAFGKVCRIKNRHTFKSLPICNSSYHDLVWYAELRIGILLKVCRFVIRHITQTDTETETELLRRHMRTELMYSSFLS